MPDAATPVTSWPERFRSEAQCLSALVQAALRQGYEYCAFALKFPIPVSRPSVFFFDSLSGSGLQYDKERGIARPCCLQSLDQDAPCIAWDAPLYFSPPTPLQEIHDHGLLGGWTLESRDNNGISGLLRLGSFKRREACPQWATLAELSKLAHHGLATLINHHVFPELLPDMTAREKEILRWTADGKTAAEIGKILNLSERTVIFHVNNASLKLGTTNKTQATIRALTLGKLY